MTSIAARPRPGIRLWLESSYARVSVALILALAAYLVVLIYFVSSYTNQLYDFRRQELQRLVELGLNAIQPIRDQQRRGELTAAQALAQGTSLIRRMTYRYEPGDNYLFMSTYTGQMLVQPFEPQKEGTDQWNLVDANGRYVIRELVAAAQSPEGQGYVAYDYPPPGSPIPQTKLSYVVAIPEWQAYLGTGMYLGDIAADNQAYIRDSLLLTGGLALAVFGVLFVALRPLLSSHHTLLRLFDQVRQDPASLPPVPLAHHRRGSEGWRLLAGFASMLSRVEQAQRDLKASQERLALVLQGTNDGFFDWNLRTNAVYYSPRWKSMLGYAEKDIGDEFEAWRCLLHTDDAERVLAELQRHLEGATPQYAVEQRLRCKDGSYRWILARGTVLRDSDGMPYRLAGSHTDITEKKQAETLLEQRVAERTQALSTLLEVSQNVNATLNLEEVLSLILDQLGRVVDYQGTSLMVLEGDALRVLAYRGPMDQDQVLQARVPLQAAPVNLEVIRRRAPVVLEDIWTDPLNRPMIEWASEELKAAWRYIHAWMGIPLLIQDRVIGMLTIDASTPGFYTEEHARLALVFANHAAIAIENARLHAETCRRADESQVLFAVQQAIDSQLELHAVLQLIADEARRLTGTDMSSVSLVHGDTAEIAVVSGGLPASLVGTRIPVEGSVGGQALRNRQPVRLYDPQGDERVPAGFKQAGIQDGILVPLLSRDQALGVITVSRKRAGCLGADDERILAMLASSAVIGLQNAQLYAQAQEMAASAERQRLARDLHDAVTQTLFSASLLAEILPKMWERDPELGRQRLQELRKLTRGALAEMRTLLLEMRPGVLAEARLPDLLRQLAEAIRGRAHVPVQVTVEGDGKDGSAGALPPEVKIALYRIAQEALNNIAKHAAATATAVHLRLTETMVELGIEDDGCGFDPTSVTVARFGLGNMRERAESIGAVLTVDSRPGHGTRVKVVWERSDGV